MLLKSIFSFKKSHLAPSRDSKSWPPSPLASFSSVFSSPSASVAPEPDSFFSPPPSPIRFFLRKLLLATNWRRVCPLTNSGCRRSSSRRLLSRRSPCSCPSPSSSSSRRRSTAPQKCRRCQELCKCFPMYLRNKIHTTGIIIRILLLGDVPPLALLEFPPPLHSFQVLLL